MPLPVLAHPTLNSHEYGAPTVWTMLPQPGSKGATARYEDLIDKLEKNKWVDLRTEALILDMTVYNPRLDFACVIRMVIETPVAGTAASLACERKRSASLPREERELPLDLRDRRGPDRSLLAG